MEGTKQEGSRKGTDIPGQNFTCTKDKGDGEIASRKTEERQINFQNETEGTER